MRVHVVMPDPVTATDVRAVLLADERIEVVNRPADAVDVQLVHASLMPEALERRRELTRSGPPLVVTDAPADPEALAGYLASGVVSYLREDEPLSLLPDVVCHAYAGDYRYDPFVMDRLLDRYRLLQRLSTSPDAFGPYLH